jgi:hypothetical protein
MQLSSVSEIPLHPLGLSNRANPRERGVDASVVIPQAKKISVVINIYCDVRRQELGFSDFYRLKLATLLAGYVECLSRLDHAYVAIEGDANIAKANLSFVFSIKDVAFPNNISN